VKSSNAFISPMFPVFSGETPSSALNPVGCQWRCASPVRVLELSAP
jgi:hypothetical protein